MSCFSIVFSNFLFARTWKSHVMEMFEERQAVENSVAIDSINFKASDL